MEERGGERGVFGVDGFEGRTVAVEDTVLKFGGPEVEGRVDGGVVNVGQKALEVFYCGCAV